LEQLEHMLTEADAATAVVTVASAAGRDVDLDEAELRGAARRALFVLAAGGDPERGLDLNGPAVTTFAADIDDGGRRDALSTGLERLRNDAVGLPYVSETVHALLAAPETAWRAFACSLLAQHIADA
jgi:hypothetical protein